MSDPSLSTKLSPLPVKRELKMEVWLSIATGVVVAVISAAGLLWPGKFYSTPEAVESFVPNDLTNLLIGLPILIASLWMTRRRKLAGLLMWPGAMLYLLYNYVAYIAAGEGGWAVIAYVLISAVSAVVAVQLVRKLDLLLVKDHLEGAVPRRFAGWLLVVFGVGFAFRAGNILVQAAIAGTNIPAGEYGTLIADLILSTLWAAGGILLLRRRPLGYAAGLGLLFAVSMLFIGLIVFFLVQPLITAAEFALVDVIIVAAMGLVCFIPFGLYWRGAAKS